MKNKIRKLLYFIYLIILSGFILPCLGLENLTKTGYIQNSTENIENIFKNNIPVKDSIIYSQVPRGLVVSLDSFLFFDQNSDEILESSKCLLDIIGEILKFIDKPCIIESNISKNTYQNSCYRSDWELTMVRAEKIADYFIKTLKIPPEKIRAAGFGSMMPFDDNVSYQGNLNHRIDFVILNPTSFIHP